jgi:hypothetical protein
VPDSGNPTATVFVHLVRCLTTVPVRARPRLPALPFPRSPGRRSRREKKLVGEGVMPSDFATQVVSDGTLCTIRTPTTAAPTFKHEPFSLSRRGASLLAPIARVVRRAPGFWNAQDLEPRAKRSWPLYPRTHALALRDPVCAALKRCTLRVHPCLPPHWRTHRTCSTEATSRRSTRPAMLRL